MHVLFGSVLEDDIFWSYLQNLKELVAIYWGTKFQGTKRFSVASKGVAHSHWPLEGSRKPGTNRVLTALHWHPQLLPPQWSPVWMGHQRAKLMGSYQKKGQPQHTTHLSSRGTLVTLSVKHPTLGFIWGDDLTVVWSIALHWAAYLAGSLLLLSLTFFPSSARTLSLSL